MTVLDELRELKRNAGKEGNEEKAMSRRKIMDLVRRVRGTEEKLGGICIAHCVAHCVIHV